MRKTGNAVPWVIGGLFAVSGAYYAYSTHKDWVLSQTGAVYDCPGGGVVRVNGHGEEEYCNLGEGDFHPEWCFDLKRTWPTSEWGVTSWDPEVESYEEFSLARDKARQKHVPECVDVSDEELSSCMLFYAPTPEEPSLDQCLRGVRTWTRLTNSSGIEQIEIPIGEVPAGAR